MDCRSTNNLREAPELLKVFLRLKPSKLHSELYEIHSDQYLMITSVDTKAGRRPQPSIKKLYKFSHIFGPGANQKEIFSHVVKENLRKLPEGNSFTLLSYGASGSGKTYTLMGTVEAPGLVPRSLEYVFKVVEAARTPLYHPGENKANKLSLAQQNYELQWVKQLRQVSAPQQDKYRRMSNSLHHDLAKGSNDLPTRTKHYVWVSFVEIYNEAIYDLLAMTERTAASKLRIREDKSGNVFVQGARQAFVRTGEEAYNVLVAGKHNLQVHSTGVHAESSRSHCIFTITMLTETESGVRASFVRLCDLAGSESARRTRNTGARMVESRAINSSLHVLERCLHTLRRGQDLVPYRESKLTRLLSAGLSGARGEAIGMVVTLNAAPENVHENRHVLQLAAVARDIQVNNTEPIATLDTSITKEASMSSAISFQVRLENAQLRRELVKSQGLYEKLLSDMQEQQQGKTQAAKELHEVRDATEKYKAQNRSMKEKYEGEISELREKYEALLIESEKLSRSLQMQVLHLTQQNAILEEQSSADRLARARMEQELAHLRLCIEERDEKASNNFNDEGAICITSSEDESNEVHDSESLEPTFKKEVRNRSGHMRQSTLNSTHNTTFDMNKTEDTIEDIDLIYFTDESIGHSTMTVDQSDETYDKCGETYDVTYHFNDSFSDYSLDAPGAVKKAHINSDLNLPSETGSATYFVDSKVELNKTYVNKPRECGINESLEGTSKINYKNNSVSVAEPAKSIETHIDKIKKLTKTTLLSVSFRPEYYFLEMEANDFGKHETAAKYDDKIAADAVKRTELNRRKTSSDNTSPSLKDENL